MKLKMNFVFKFFTYLFLVVLGILVAAPVLLAFFGSFKAPTELLVSSKILPESFDPSNYISAWTRANFARFTWNSLWYSAGSVVITVYVSCMCGYVFARGEFRGQKILFAMFTALMFIVLGTTTLYPALQIRKMLHLNKGLWTLLVTAFFSIPMSNVFLVRGYLNGIPRTMDEAAEIDGCNFVQIFFKILLPMMTPIIATVSIFAFSGAWNNYLWPMILTMGAPKQQPLAVGLIALQNSTGGGATEWGVILAGGMISAIPILIVYCIFNKYFVTGISAGAVKG